MGFIDYAKHINDPEVLATEYLARYFKGNDIQYPINPFKMLKDEGVLFSIRSFDRLEGIYIPASGEDDMPLAGINGNRPITRQRFTAAHELCHHFKDSDKAVSCPISGVKNKIEKYADDFAAALLMPYYDMKKQISLRSNDQGHISFDSALEIAELFGVSFKACVYRIAYVFNAIEGDIDSDSLGERIKKYKADKKRKERGYSYSKLYADLIDNYEEQLHFRPSERYGKLFKADYIYNDSRMEGVNVTIEEASEIVSDLLLNAQYSKYCNENNEPFMSVAGHHEMYNHILAFPYNGKVSVFSDCFKLNKELFSYFPNPEYGGKTRERNTLVLGAKFETVDYTDIYPEMLKVESDIKEFQSKFEDSALSKRIQFVVNIHHRLTLIHPFMDGNGRTLRAFMNLQLVSMGLPPIYIKTDHKNEYLEALVEADNNNMNDLYEVIYKSIIRCHMDLNK